jgi:hypothetical protein
VNLSASATDDISGVQSVSFRVERIGWGTVFQSTDTTAPYEAAWDASTSPNGDYNIYVTALDNKGNFGAPWPPNVHVVLANDVMGPQVSLASPTF